MTGVLKNSPNMGDLSACFDSPFGGMKICASDKGIRSLEWLPQPQPRQVPQELKEAVLQLEAYFAGEAPVFDLALDWSGKPAFDQQVWEYLQTIPYGATASYTDVALALGDAKKVRAVGGANARNPIPVIVPCHRVVGKNGQLTGFAYGLDLKARLLALERPDVFAAQKTLF